MPAKKKVPAERGKAAPKKRTSTTAAAKRMKATKSATGTRTAKRGTMKKVASSSRSSTTAKRAATKKAATRSSGTKRTAAKPVVKSRTAPRKTVRKAKPTPRPELYKDWPLALPDRNENIGKATASELPVPVPARPTRGPKPLDLRPDGAHMGQTAEHGNTHDRPGSGPERVRHLYPNGNRPNSGSARSTQHKGQRRTTKGDDRS